LPIRNVMGAAVGRSGFVVLIAVPDRVTLAWPKAIVVAAKSMARESRILLAVTMVRRT
jgi:hypothetical protein